MSSTYDIIFNCFSTQILAIPARPPPQGDWEARRLPFAGGLHGETLAPLSPYEPPHGSEFVPVSSDPGFTQDGEVST